MPNRTTLLPVIASLGIGIALFIMAAALTHKREPRDSSLYWIAVYPLAIVASAALGYTYPERLWSWPLWLFETQFLAMCICNGELSNLWPFCMALFAIIALPAVVTAKIGAKFKHQN